MPVVLNVTCHPIPTQRTLRRVQPQPLRGGTTKMLPCVRAEGRRHGIGKGGGV